MFYISQSRVIFDNTVVVIVRKEFRNDILLDGKQLTTWTSYWDYAIGWSPITHDRHLIQVVPGSAAKFAAYVYGHSVLDSSSSAYGYTVAFKGQSSIIILA